jgi:hypothetical protein
MQVLRHMRRLKAYANGHAAKTNVSGRAPALDECAQGRHWQSNKAGGKSARCSERRTTSGAWLGDGEWWRAGRLPNTPHAVSTGGGAAAWVCAAIRALRNLAYVPIRHTVGPTAAGIRRELVATGGKNHQPKGNWIGGNAKKAHRLTGQGQMWKTSNSSYGSGVAGVTASVAAPTDHSTPRPKDKSGFDSREQVGSLITIDTHSSHLCFRLSGRSQRMAMR